MELGLEMETVNILGISESGVEFDLILKCYRRMDVVLTETKCYGYWDLNGDRTLLTFYEYVRTKQKDNFT